MTLRIFTKKYGEQEVFIDDEDYCKLHNYGWTLWSSVRHYGIYVIGYLKRGKNKSIRLHRLITNAQKGQIVDHINGNPLDNRKCNLRVTTSLVNNQNARKRKDGKTSKYKGVSYSKQENKWKAQIQINKVKKSLGSYSLEEKAAEAYNEAVERYQINSPKNKITIDKQECK